MKIPCYDERFRRKAVTEVLRQGLKPVVRQTKIARNTLRTWVRLYQKGAEHLLVYNRHRARFSLEFEKHVASLKEKNPTCTLVDIQKTLRQEMRATISINGIHRILERYGMAGRSFLPLRVQATAETEHGSKLARMLTERGNIQGAASILNGLPSLSDFSILEKIPARFLSPRRQAEQLEALLDKLSPTEIYEKAVALRRICEREKLTFTAIFVATLEMSCLNRIGHHVKTLMLYRKFCPYLPGLTGSLKYTFLTECFMTYTNMPEKFPEKKLKKLPYSLVKYCSTLPDEHRLEWYDALSACFQIIGDINKSLKWTKKMIHLVPREQKKEYLPEYFSLLAIKGSYSKVLEYNESIEVSSKRSSLTLALTRGNALLGIGEVKQALEITFEAFSEAEKGHLYPAMAGFTFFIACCYGALKETEKVKRYLRMSVHFSANAKKMKELYSLLLRPTAQLSVQPTDLRRSLVNRYQLACETLRKRDFTKAWQFANKKGLLGFFHRIVLLNPEAVINRLRRGEQTYLPKEFLDLPVFKEEQRIFRLLLLKEKESISYGDRKIDISPHTKDFHLLVYLFLNRKKNLNRENIFDIFYRTTRNPSKTLSKAFSRIRRILNLPKGALFSRKEGVMLNIELKIDFEEFEETYKMGKVLAKVGETSRAHREYQQCFTLYRRSPFEKMGYYYNFAEERRTAARHMYEDLCNILLSYAKEKGEEKVVKKIMRRLKEEGLQLSVI